MFCRTVLVGAIRFWTIGAALAVVACGGSDGWLAPSSEQALLTITSGGNQTVKRGEQLAQAVVARLEINGAPGVARELELSIQPIAESGLGGKEPTVVKTGVSDATGMVSFDGVKVDVTPGAASMFVKYVVCTRRNGSLCAIRETLASAIASLTVVP